MHQDSVLIRGCRIGHSRLNRKTSQNHSSSMQSGSLRPNEKRLYVESFYGVTVQPQGLWTGRYSFCITAAPEAIELSFSTVCFSRATIQ